MPVKSRFPLSPTQLSASVLAAVTATIAASYLGVAGTVIGAALASVLTVVGNAVYSHSIARTRDRVLAAVPAAWLPALPDDLTEPVGSAAGDGATNHSLSAGRPRPGEHAQLRPGLRLALACLAVFAVLNLAVTGFELVAGKPLSDLLRGRSASGTTLFGGAASHTTPTPTTTVTVTPSVVVTTPTVTQTAPPVTSTVTPTVTSTGSPSGTNPSSTPSSPSGTTTP